MADLTAMMQAAAGAGGGEPTDPFFNQTTLLLHGDGTNGAQNNTFLDSSTNNFTITRNGNTTQGSFSPFSKPEGKFGNFFGTNGALIFSSNAAYAIGTGNFTVECFANFDEWSGTSQRVFIQGVSGTTNVSLGREGGGTALNVDINTTNVISYTWTPNIGQWYHLAVVRTGTGSGQVALYIDGVSVATGTSSASIGQNQFIVGGLTWAGGYNIRGYLSNFRYSNVARTITVPTAPYTSDGNTLILTCQSNRFKDNSSNNFAINGNGDVKVTPFSPYPLTTAYDTAVNGGSGFFDGSGDFLSLPSNAAFGFGSGDFTMECWFYKFPTSLDVLIDTRIGAGGNANGLALYVQSGALKTGNTVELFSGGTVVVSSWNHCAIVRSSNTLSLYLNGTRVATGAFSTAQAASSSPYIGNSVTNEYTTGYLANVRLLKGTAQYTGTTYTVPTAPLTAITNTSLLTNFTNAGIFDNTGKNNLETGDNAQIDTAITKYGTGSMEFDGSGDFLIIPPSSLLSFEGDFTIECWINTSTSGVDTYFRRLLCFGVDNAANIQLLFFDGSTATPNISFYTGVIQIAGTIIVADGNWKHIALCRSDTSIRLFVNGVQSGSTATNSTVFNYGATYGMFVGRYAAAGGGFLNGYIDDLRITKGIARYTAAFTPPTAAFPNIGD